MPLSWYSTVPLFITIKDQNKPSESSNPFSVNLETDQTTKINYRGNSFASPNNQMSIWNMFGVHIRYHSVINNLTVLRVSMLAVSKFTSICRWHKLEQCELQPKINNTVTVSCNLLNKLNAPSLVPNSPAQCTYCTDLSVIGGLHTALNPQHLPHCVFVPMPHFKFFPCLPKLCSHLFGIND